VKLCKTVIYLCNKFDTMYLHYIMTTYVMFNVYHHSNNPQHFDIPVSTLLLSCFLYLKCIMCISESM